jgi:SOS-response transcriptional repressor LexA
VRKNLTIDWTLRENVRAQLRVLVKRVLRKYGYPPDKQEKATQTVLEQAEALSGGWAEVLPSEYQPEAKFRLRLVQPRREDRYVTCVPFVSLKVAAGAFGDPQHLEDENWEWVEIDSKHRLRQGMFVSQVVGKSMEPLIPDGAYCLFASPVEGSRQGKIVLVQLRDEIDLETGERYTVKRYGSTKTQDEESWRHSSITLKPVNPAFETIQLTEVDEENVQVIAECIEVLG